MKTEIRKTVVYLAEDGKEFLSENECKKYEKTVLEDKKNIRYFCVRYCPDLTETGLFQKQMFVAVLSRYHHREIVENWCVNEKNLEIIGESVQGCGFQPHFEIVKCTEEEYFRSKIGRITGESFKVYDQGQYFLSPKKVEGFPEDNFNYIENWGLK